MIVVMGPTAAGKSNLALKIAESLAGEIISADSMQVYCGFDIGTGKATDAERGRAPHHLIDILDPGEAYSAAQFRKMADEAILDIHARDGLPIIAGGTGLYLRALLYGLFEAPESDPKIRSQHEKQAAEEGVEALYLQLQEVDPNAASRISGSDFVRISRALEVFQQTGRPISELQAEHAFSTSRYKTLRIGLDPGRELLNERIENRIDAMMDSGWLAEVQRLIAAGYGDTRAMGALGYKQLAAHCRGELDLEDAVRQTKRDTRHFSRRQRNWFRSEANVHWFENVDDVDLAWVKDSWMESKEEKGG
jgi:tRNA dimethylallyltransferase